MKSSYLTFPNFLISKNKEDLCSACSTHLTCFSFKGKYQTIDWSYSQTSICDKFNGLSNNNMSDRFLLKCFWKILILLIEFVKHIALRYIRIMMIFIRKISIFIAYFRFDIVLNNIIMSDFNKMWYVLSLYSIIW